MTQRMTAERKKALEVAARELAGLHADWRGAMSHHELRVEAQFKELARRIKPKASGKALAGVPSAKQARDILDLLDKARTKPEKGRAKDLRRVEHALQRALDRLPPQG
jgi:hypothetical protein